MILGAVLLVAFCFWEAYGAKYPMFPKRLRQEPRILSLTLIITFISGANFFSILMWWPTQSLYLFPTMTSRRAELMLTSSQQRLWTRSCVSGSFEACTIGTDCQQWCRNSWTSNWLFYPGRCLHRPLASFSIPWPQQGDDDSVFGPHDSWLWSPVGRSCG